MCMHLTNANCTLVHLNCICVVWYVYNIHCCYIVTSGSFPPFMVCTYAYCHQIWWYVVSLNQYTSVMDLSLPVSILITLTKYTHITLIRAYVCSMYQHVSTISFACMTGQLGVAQRVPAVPFSTRGRRGQLPCT